MPQYALGSDDTEIGRLQTQAVMLAGPTELLLQRAGIRRGMRVLDLGAGPGDVTFQVAGMVGAEGYVVGLELDPAQLAVAERRRAAMNVANVEFRQGDACTFATVEPFDAVVCRLLLLHLPNAAEVIRHHRDNLRPGGLFVAIDYDTGSVRTLPEVALFSQVLNWLNAAFRHAKADPFIGMRLPTYFEQAGYQKVDSLGLQMYLRPSDPLSAEYVTGVAKAMKPALLRSGVTTEDELGLDTLTQRLADALQSANAVFTMPTVVGVWGRRPG